MPRIWVIKYWSVLLIFYMPFTFLCARILFPPWQWDYISSRPIQLAWTLITCIITFTLSILEVNGLKLKEKFKYYYWLTLFLYEAVGILSFVAYIDALMSAWSVQGEQPQTMFEYVLSVSRYVAIWISYILLWTHVFFIHILFRKGIEMQIDEQQENSIRNRILFNYTHYIPYMKKSIFVFVFLCYGISLGHVFISGLQLFEPDIELNVLSSMEASISAIFGLIIMASSDGYSVLNVAFTIFLWIGCLINMVGFWIYLSLGDRPEHFIELHQVNFIFLWICCISTGRRINLRVDYYIKKSNLESQSQINADDWWYQHMQEIENTAWWPLQYMFGTHAA